MGKATGILIFIFLLVLATIRVGMRVNSNYVSPEQEHELKEVRKAVQNQSTFEFGLLLNPWMRIITDNNQDYITETTFADEGKGERLVYLTNNGNKGCYIKQPCQWKLGIAKSGFEYMNTLTVHYSVKDSKFINCSEQEVIKITNLLSKTDKTIRWEVKTNPVTLNTSIQGHQKSAMHFDEEKNDLVKIKVADPAQVKTVNRIEKEFNYNFVRPKNSPRENSEILVEPDSLRVTFRYMSSLYSLGRLEKQKGNYYLTGIYYDGTGPCSESGILKNIKYKHWDGELRTGDLVLCADWRDFSKVKLKAIR